MNAIEAGQTEQLMPQRRKAEEGLTDHGVAQ